jgi:hypothetical protein
MEATKVHLTPPPQGKYPEHRKLFRDPAQVFLGWRGCARLHVFPATGEEARATVYRARNNGYATRPICIYPISVGATHDNRQAKKSEVSLQVIGSLSWLRLNAGSI